MLKISITQKQDKLKSYCTSDLGSLMEKYFEERKWNSDFGDIIPIIAAETFNVTLVILKNVEGKLNQVIINEGGNKVLGLILENDHYSYIRKEQNLKNIIEKTKNQNRIESSISKDSMMLDTEKSKIPRTVDYTQQAKLILNYSSEKSTKKIKQTIRSLDKNNEIQVIFKSAVRFLDLIKQQQVEGVNNRNNSEHIEKKTGAIYQASCVKCLKEKKNAFYIGETGRKLQDRIKEHMKQVKEVVDPTKISAIALHAMRVHNSQPSRVDWDFKILDVAQSTLCRKILEAHFIKKIKPNLNREDSVSIINFTRKGFK
jgi:DNA polymerase III alpha subunit (gram-positive type)